MLTLLLLALALSQTPPSPEPAARPGAASAAALPPDAEVGVYLPQPRAGGEPATPGEAWSIEAHVYATIDTPTTVTVTLDLDPRLWIGHYGAVATAPGAHPRCRGIGPLICTVPVQRWHPAVVVAEVTVPGGAWRCADLVVQARAEGAALPPSTRTRTRPIAGSESCGAAYLPLIGGL